MLMHVAEKTMDQADGLRRMIQPREGEPSKPDDLTVVVFRPSS